MKTTSMTLAAAALTALLAMPSQAATPWQGAKSAPMLGLWTLTSIV